MDSIDCRDFYPNQSRVGALGQSELALVHRLCRGKPISVFANALVFDGGYPGQVGRCEQGSASGEHCSVLLGFLKFLGFRG
jgi:hypothetical protein